MPFDSRCLRSGVAVVKSMEMIRDGFGKPEASAESRLRRYWNPDRGQPQLNDDAGIVATSRHNALTK